jgi:uncharacterized membrane protein YcaP (DUF421 family)
MDPLRLVLRVLAAYAILLALLRLTNKRVIDQSTPFDLVLALIVGDMVDDLVWREVSALEFLAGVGVLLLAQVAVSLAVYRSERVARWVEGRSRIVMSAGRARTAALRAERVNERELAEMLRERGLPRRRWGEVREARLETSGELSVLSEPPARPLRKADLGG